MNFDDFYSKSECYFSGSYSGGLAECLKKYGVTPCLALDLGAGEGRNSFFLASEGYDVISVEPSKIGAGKILNRLEREKFKIQVYNSNFLNVSSKLSELGLVVALTSLEHMEYNEITQTVLEIKRILKPGGYIYVLVFTEDDPGYKRDIYNASECSMFIKHYFKKGELRELFSDFSILEYREYIKKDTTHGPVHFHGKAKLFARKPL